MAIAFLSAEKFKRVKEAIGLEDKKKFVEEYKRIGGVMKEGTNEQIEGTHKYAAFFDAKRMKKTKKTTKKRKKK